MATTAMFVELLVCGFQTMVWISLLTISIFGWNWIPLDLIEKFSGILTVFVLGISYVFGILIDRLSDTLFHKFDLKLRAKFITDEMPKASEMRIAIMRNSEKVCDFLWYIRSRIRISRATFLNTLITLFASIIFILSHKAIIISPYLLIIKITFLLCLPILILSWFSWKRISVTFYKRLIQAYSK